MDRFELVIVGGGLAGARAIREYRAAGGSGSVALLSREESLPYHRPPLSKRYLRGEVGREDTLVEPQEFYEENGVELLLGTEVTGIDTGDGAVTTADRRYGYRKLLLATGAQPRTLDVPGADLPGVFALRSLEDSTSIREAAEQTRDAVVVGSGFIGMEVAASLTELGRDVSLVSRDVDLFASLRSPEISDHLVALYRRRGVDVVRGDEVRAFHGGSRLDTVELRSGRKLGAGVAVVGVGVRPAVSFLAGSGISTDDGVLVDKRFETNVPGVFAVGDMARFFDPVFNRSRRIEHWSNAAYQGAEAGKVLAGAGGGYDTVSTFFTESFGLPLKVFGDTSRHDERVARGSFGAGDAIVFYLEGGRLAGTLHTGQGEETEQALRRLIAAHASPRKLELLADAGVPLEEAFSADAALPRV